MKKIIIKNISSATVVLSFSDLGFRRDLTPGRSLTVERDTFNEMTFDPGFNSLIEEHYLLIKGLEEDEEISTSSSQVFDVSSIERIINDQDIVAFAKMIPTATPAEKETIVQLAIDKKITNSAFVSLIKKYCDVDIMSAINLKYLAEEN